MLITGCGGNGSETVDYKYGRRTGAGYAQSLNGTLIFSELFEQRGYSVTSRKRVTPKMGGADVVIWFPDTHGPPDPEAIEFLYRWLNDSPSRVLVYVGRDYDAEVAYWQFCQQNADQESMAETNRKFAEAKVRELSRNASIPDDITLDDIDFKKLDKPKTIDTYEGPWVDDEFELNQPVTIHQYLDTNVAPPTNYYDKSPIHQTLLTSGSIPIVTIYESASQSSSKVILVSNASFLLNYALVDRQNRELAMKLVDTIEDENKKFGYYSAFYDGNGKVVFLESGPNGPMVSENEHEETKSIWNWIKVKPFHFVIPHLIVFAVVACCYLFPIFGRAKKLKTDSPFDFGKHVSAYGDMLEKTGNSAYARRLIDAYRNRKTRARVSHEK
jgi:hypothetical protein